YEQAPAISHDRIDRISDRGWLQILRNAARPDGDHERRHFASGSITDLSAQSYANLLGAQAAKQPQRFARFALEIPPDLDLAYVPAILFSISKDSPPNQETTDWAPPTDSQIAALVEHVGYKTAGDVGQWLCMMMLRRLQAVKRPACYEILVRYA